VSSDWHEKTIQSLALYQEKLERVEAHIRNELVIQRVARGEAGQGEMPRTVKVPGPLWTELREAEEPARANLRLANMFTDLKTQVECSTALSSTVNAVSGQWMDLSPEPTVPWASLSIKAITVGSLREKLQISLKEALELDGLWASLFPTAARWRLIYRIKKEQKRLARSAS
jgi:hypothetical protein